MAAATAAGAAGDELGLETVVSRALDGYVFSFFLLCVFLLNSYLLHLDHVHGTRKNEHHKLPRHNEGYHYHNGGPLRTKRGLYDEKKAKKVRETSYDVSRLDGTGGGISALFSKVYVDCETNYKE